MSEAVSYQFENNICTITMDDGRANAMSPGMIAELEKAFDLAEKDGGVVVLKGREGKFSAGFDLKVFQEGGTATLDMIRAGAELSERLLKYPYPIIASCTGHGMAMGAFLLLSADYRIGAEGSFKLGLNEVKIGMTMPQFGIEIARARLPLAFLNRAVNNAEIFTPTEAVQAGYLDEVVALDNLDSRVNEKAEELSGLNMGAHLGTKLRTREGLFKDLRAAIEKEFPRLD